MESLGNMTAIWEWFLFVIHSELLMAIACLLHLPRTVSLSLAILSIGQIRFLLGVPFMPQLLLAEISSSSPIRLYFFIQVQMDYTWIANPYISGNWMTALTYGQGTFVATILGGSIYQSGAFASQSNCPATTLGISTYPGVTINGTAGAVYQIQYTTSLNSTWQTLTNFMLPYSPYLWVDTSSTVSGQRFYRSIQLK